MQQWYNTFGRIFTMYLYETHLHTVETSACARTPGSEYPAYYKALGYSGIFVTDHFFNGSCAIHNTGNWEEMVNAFCRGYEAAKKAGDAIGFPVFFGWEANFEGDEYLIYGLDKQWLLDHPDILSYSRTKQYDEVRKSGGLVVQAHPFRERSYLNAIRLNPDTCDAMEGYNAFNEPYQNGNAELYCTRNNIFMTAGTDLHRIGSINEHGPYGMQFDRPLNCEADYVRAILNREGRMIVPEKDRILPDAITTKLPVILNHRE